MKNQILFLPGPQKNLYPKGKKLNIYHRSTTAMKINEQMKNQLNSVFKTQESLLLPFSASEAFDLFCRSLNIDKIKQVAVIDTGYWSQNLIKILSKNDFQVTTYDKSILQLPAAEMQELIVKDSATIFFATLMETATGEISSFSAFYSFLKQNQKFLFLDAVSYPYFYDFNQSFLNRCDFGLVASAKNFLSVPGFSFLLFKEPIQNYSFFSDRGYTNVFLFKKFLETNQFPHTYNGRGLETIQQNFLFITEHQKEYVNKIDELRELFLQSLDPKIFTVLNAKGVERNNLVVLKIDSKFSAQEIIEYLTKNNIYVGTDLMQQNTIRICFSYLNTLKEVKKLSQMLNRLPQVLQVKQKRVQ